MVSLKSASTERQDGAVPLVASSPARPCPDRDLQVQIGEPNDLEVAIKIVVDSG
jgi:hypothetical protein